MKEQSPRCWRAVVAIAALLLAMGCSRPATAPPTGPQITAAAAPREERTALDDYVAAPDTNYSFHLLKTVPGAGQTTFILEMTSQAWLTTNQVDRPLWKHWMIIVRPETLQSSKSLLFIDGGANDRPPPKGADGNLLRIALATHSVVTELRMVPNQPLVFAGETQRRTEDAIIAYTWDKFLRTGDAKWPARLPMTKAAVRAMDTVTAFCSGPEAGGLKLEKFVVAGASKRGWTTWTTAAVDRRVIGIIPIVIDLLNIEPSFMHHYAAYGFWAPAIQDYERFGIMDWTGTPQYHALMDIVEPYSYRRRYTMPKFLINDTGDQFFLPDSSQFYFKDLPGIKYLRYIPNTDHSLRGSDAPETILACYHALLYGDALPRFWWELEKDGAIRVTTQTAPLAVKLWQATNPDARDFRLETFGPHWESSDLAPQSEGVYVAKVPEPAKGWTGFFVELTFRSGCQAPFKFTTQVRVVPDKLLYHWQRTGPPP